MWSCRVIMPLSVLMCPPEMASVFGGRLFLKGTDT